MTRLQQTDSDRKDWPRVAMLARQGERKKAEPAPRAVRAVVAWEVRGVIVNESGEAQVVCDLDLRARLEAHIELLNNGAAAVAMKLVATRDADAKAEAAIELELPEQGPPASARWIEDHKSGLIHIDAGDLLSATWRRGKKSDAAGSLLYARTSIMNAIGLPGGRSEAPCMRSIER